METSKRTIALSYGNNTKNVGGNSKTLVSALVGASSKNDVLKQLNKIEAISLLNESEMPDIISDLSLKTSGKTLYNHIIKEFPQFIVSTLPIYQCGKDQLKIDPSELLDISIQQIESGVSFITIHPTPNKYIIQLAQKRLVPWTSRGGSIVIKDLLSNANNLENVYLQILDDLIKIAQTHKTVLSIGASFRSANIFDSLDECQIEEFKIQEQLAQYITSRNVSVIIEGPGHSTPKKLKQIAAFYNKIGAPIMPLGPIPTDIAIGQDHISSSIGAVLLGIENCVDIITSVTREEHTGGIPSITSTIEAIKAAKIAAHIIDINKLNDTNSDKEIANYRATYQTCILGKKHPGCNRCVDVCPLIKS